MKVPLETGSRERKDSMYKEDFFIEESDRLTFYCPACGFCHSLDNKWFITWLNDKPSATPSIVCDYPWGEERTMQRCHSYIEHGIIKYLNDCTHNLKGQSVQMIKPPIRQ